MKTLSFILILFSVGLAPHLGNAQSGQQPESDDLYFTAADREVLNAKLQAEEEKKAQQEAAKG